MNREQRRRRERVSETLRERRHQRLEALHEASRWSPPRGKTGAKQLSLGTNRGEYTFSDEQFLIALASLDRQTND